MMSLLRHAPIKLCCRNKTQEKDGNTWFNIDKKSWKINDLMLTKKNMGKQGQYEKGHILIYLSHILPGQMTCNCPSQEGR
jgi:hypothetical protein